jgi:hypothetical protein
MTNEESKQQAIKNAYGEYWELVKNHVDSNGFLKYGDIRNETIGLKDSEIEITDYNFNIDFEVWRPKQLQGIESNNGWINASDTLPTEFGFYHVEVENNEQDLLAYFNLELKTWSIGVFEFNIKKWQPINYPKKSIY